MTTNNNYYSLEGYVSDGIYVMAPFVEEEADKKYFKNKYRQVGAAGAANLLQNSTRTLSIIGTRFKSANSGFIMGPKYDSVNQNIFGTDSIAYMGLLRR